MKSCSNVLRIGNWKEKATWALSSMKKKSIGGGILADVVMTVIAKLGLR